MERQHGYVPPSDTGPKLVPKRLIVCCDGTWQASNHATHEVPSNVAKIARAVSKTFVNEQNLSCPQIVHYDAGVATADLFDNKIAGYFGAGLDKNVCEAYSFLANNYNPGDEVFFFGFSRGAYTARACAGLVAKVGICKDIQMSRFWEMYSIYKTKDHDTPIEATDWGKQNDVVAVKTDGEMKSEDWITISKGDKRMAPYVVRKGVGAGWLAYCQKPVDIKIVGVFDTVGSLGYPVNIFTDVTAWNKAYQFHDTVVHPEIQNAFQALALDERRAPFAPTLWNLPSENRRTNLIQCWFPGIHVNIGGGSDDGLKRTPKGDLESMANTTFAWMVDRCRPFLHFDDKVLAFIVDKYYETLQTLTNRSLAGSPSQDETVGWGVGLNHAGIVENVQKGWMTTLGGLEDRTPGQYPNKPNTHECIHPVVYHAQREQRYSSRALQLAGFNRVPNEQGHGHSWVRTYTEDEAKSWKHQTWGEWAGSMLNRHTIKKDAQSVTITLPEFVIPKMIIQQSSQAPGRYYANPLERLLIIRNLWTEEQTQQAFESEQQFLQRKSNILAKQSASNYLMTLDEDNKFTKFIAANVAWGTPVGEPKQADDPFTPKRSGA